MTHDFSGYATKNDLNCTDGRVIRHGAFKDQDGHKVPLVWQHLHDDPSNVLGHAILECRKDGVYAYAFFNQSEAANNARAAVVHGDVNSLSIYANRLVQHGSDVVHGVIREVSLVLAGANPGAVIDNIALAHGDDVYEDDSEAIIRMGEEIVHADEDDDDDGDETVQDVIDTMNEKQQKVLLFLVNEALNAGAEEAGNESESAAKHDDTEGDDALTHNAFDGSATKTDNTPTLSHSDVQNIFNDAKKIGSLKEAVLQHSKQYGVSNIDMLFPDAKNFKNIPETISQRVEWVPGVLNGCTHTPFSRVRTRQVDITADEARARGYVTAAKKTEQVVKMLQRETLPKTVYTKQKFDRDDLLDITDFDTVAWIKGLMRGLLEEELARAILMGDGREVGQSDKINEDNLRPICGDDDLFVRYVDVESLSLRAGDHKYDQLVDTLTEALVDYRGSGTPTLYIGAAELIGMMLVRDKMGHRLYKTRQELAEAIGVKEIVRVDLLGKRGVTSADTKYQWFGVMVNLADYNIGADKGGQTTMFEDFDIDYNQEKFLLETRLSGALTKVQSAVVLYQKGTENKAPGSD